MKPCLIRPAARLKGEVSLSGDKSIAHRAIILSSISCGKTLIRNFPSNKDCQETVNAFKKLGIKIKFSSGALIVYGKGLYGLEKPKSPIFISESGTTFRLLAGVLAAQDFSSALKAGRFLSKRPMLRVTAPLRKMGARIVPRPASHVPRNEEYPPFTIKGSQLNGITYKMPLASAQVKSALLLAGLYAKGKTKVIEPLATRDHTERMLKLFKAKIKVSGNTIIVENKPLVSPKKIYIPADISSAAFLIVAALLVPGSRIVIKNVSLNPSRAGALGVLKRMGANIRIRRGSSGGEPRGDIVAAGSRLKAALVREREIPSLIDEVPVLMVASSLASGTTIFKGVKELRVKETDRIRSMAENLNKMGARVCVVKRAAQEDIVIKGVSNLGAAKVRSFGDHRTAMSIIVAGLAAKGATSIDDVSCISKSFPEFLKVLNSLK